MSVTVSETVQSITVTENSSNIVISLGTVGSTGVSDHTLLSNIGSNTHAQIDTHIANTSNPHSVTKAQVGLTNVVDADTTTTANITDSSNKRFVTDAQLTVIGNTSGTNTGDQSQTTAAISASEIDWSTLYLSGGLYTKTLGANTTFTFANAVAGQTIIVRLTNTASNYTVTWPTVKWSGGTPPTMTVGAKSDIYTFIYDGTDYFGSYVQDMS